ncbi:WAS/WASL-interacting protein family member 3-like isoform X2 [Triticum urartu]|uniref:WAS/WASL-interacting protein family member 3-like isoform X2 n=1 Tax=Triticum urartu TaxID=4572 RepID=UPI002043AE5A|nr:WAS/WASL-interacting protein family member 3-like isoform X2 [Triticum urartu]XP_048566260.1 WAS/WASL-interacting protein family member 3-like isoform X2 [Triticum urartu]XP_048566261.1 WAS/WASL-interacting protein family member 3-like isoform X2 [Triticum urartu]XP_048566262.1 WAS/WASL-interacting protein family member 3-like isoform X2 [Triticum urartu]
MNKEYLEDHANLMVIDPVLIPESYLSTKNIESVLSPPAVAPTAACLLHPPHPASVLPPPALAPTAPCLLPPPPPTVPNLQQQLLPTVTVLAPTNLPPLPPATVKHPMVDWKETSVRAAEPSDDEHEWDLKARWCCGA